LCRKPLQIPPCIFRPFTYHKVYRSHFVKSIFSWKFVDFNEIETSFLRTSSTTKIFHETVTFSWNGHFDLTWCKFFTMRSFNSQNNFITQNYSYYLSMSYYSIYYTRRFIQRINSNRIWICLVIQSNIYKYSRLIRYIIYKCLIEKKLGKVRIRRS